MNIGPYQVESPNSGNRPALGRILNTFRIGLCVLACASVHAAGAQIVVGQISGFTGPVAAGVKENTLGAQLYFDKVNRDGGVHGQKIDFVSMDDHFNPRESLKNAETLIVEKKAIALFLNRGADHVQAIIPLLDKYRVALVAPTSGALVLHKPVQPWIFHIRAPYQREMEKAVLHLASIGVTRIALVRVDDSFGQDCADGAMVGFEKAKLQPLFTAIFNREKPDFSSIAGQVVRSQAQAVFLLGASAAVAAGTQAIRQAGSAAQIVTQSTNASSGFIKLMGINARGTIVTQGFPSERSRSFAVVNEAIELAAKSGMNELTPAMLEGYIGAKVLVEGLRRAGSPLTREGLKKALHSVSNLDIGGLKMSFSNENHTGMDFAEISIIDQGGKFQR